MIDNPYKDISDFKWERVARMKADGTVSHIELPTDREGYARFFARKMSEGAKDEAKTFEYWYKYIKSMYNFKG